MGNGEAIETEWVAHSYRASPLSSIPDLPATKLSDNVWRDLWQDFFGTKADKQKSLFVFSMLLLIAGFFILSSVSLSMDIIVGLLLVGFGIYGGVRWTRQFLKEIV